MNIGASNFMAYSSTKKNKCMPDDVNTFKQVCFEQLITLPMQKPNIGQISNVNATPVIRTAHLAVTPVGTSLEGQRLTGRKIVIIGEVGEYIEYVADCPEQSIHVVPYKIPFSTFIVVPKYFDNKPSHVETAFIEHINTEKIDCRTIYQSINLLVTLEW